MTTLVGKPIVSQNGYSVCRVYVKDSAGNFVLAGYGIFGSDGKLIAAYPKRSDALRHMKQLANPAPPPPPANVAATPTRRPRRPGG